jgi:multidrug efflux pump subunit AcrA (membrane-fusion protein)
MNEGDRQIVKFDAFYREISDHLMRGIAMMKKTLIAGFVVLAVILSGCGAGAEETATPEVAADFVPVVSVTGEVVPAVWATISAQNGGTVVEVLVEPGSEVTEGDLLVRLDSTDAQLAIHQAEAALGTARAQLALLQASAQPEDVAAAEAQIEAARAALAEAEIAAAEAEVMSAELARKAAEDQYDQMIRGKIHGWIEEQAILRLRAAEEALEAAQARLAQAQGGAGAQKRAADAAVWAAKAQEDIAQAQLDLLQSGATAKQIAVSEAAVAEAQAALEAASVSLERTEVRAPFAGTAGLVSVRVGELIAPGQPLVTLGDLATLRIETTDLDEIDVAQVAVGQIAAVTFDALPERVFNGQVARVSPMSEPGAGGVHYTVVIVLDETDPAIRWGMTAFVDIEVE